MSLTVLSVAFPFAPVGPSAVGGAEQVLADMDRALVRGGHTSLVVACEGSEPQGELFAAPLPASERLDKHAKQSCRRDYQLAIERALHTREVDLIHLHGMDFDQYAFPSGIPIVVTLHLPIDWYAPKALATFAERAQLVCVSESQRRTCPEKLRENILVIPNGVELPDTHTYAKEDYAIALGRICPEKNFHEALEAGTLAGIRVLLGGQVFPYEEHQKYFVEKIQPLLCSETGGVTHQFMGPLDASRRQHLLARARCLLHPTLAPETSSLVAMEAMAAGTPVIAYRSGALTEIVEDGVNGLLVNNVTEMADAIKCVAAISPQTCRTTAAQRFSHKEMVQSYFDLYRSLTQRNTLEPAYA